MENQYDLSGSTLDGPSFQISFDAAPYGAASNFTFSVNGQPVIAAQGSFDWYANAIDVGNGQTIFRGEIDDIIPNRFGNGTDIGDLFYQGHLYTLASMTVTDPPVSVSEPWGLIGLLIFAALLGAVIRRRVLP